MHESQQVRAEDFAILVSVLDDGIADGSFRPVDTKVVARAIMSVNQWAWTWYESDDARPPETVPAQFNDLFQGGLVNDRAALPEPAALSEHIALWPPRDRGYGGDDSIGSVASWNGYGAVRRRRPETRRPVTRRRGHAVRGGS